MNVARNPFDGTFDSLETLVDTISEVLQCPVTLEDANHRLLAYSSHEPQTDPARIATIIGRRVPEKVINSLWRDGVIQQLLSSEDPIRIPAIHDVGLGNRVAISIRKNDDVLGYIWVLEVENRLNDEALIQLKKAAQAARTKLLQLQVHKRKQQEGIQEFFWKLLTGLLKSQAQIREHAAQLLLSLPAAYQVIVFRFTEEIHESMHQNIHYLLTTTQRVRIVCSAADRNQLILLAGPVGKTASKQDFADFISDFIYRMKDRYQVENVIAGSGTLVDGDYTQVEAGFREAAAVIRIKQQFPVETRDIFYYEDLGFYRYLPAMLEQKRAHSIGNPQLHRLRDYDREHRTCLLKTLEVFLSHDCNVKDAADHLHVHVNTMNYRLVRISEIAGIDLKNIDQKISLYLDLKMEGIDSDLC